MTAPISNLYRCGCHGMLECPALLSRDAVVRPGLRRRAVASWFSMICVSVLRKTTMPEARRNRPDNYHVNSP